MNDDADAKAFVRRVLGRIPVWDIESLEASWSSDSDAGKFSILRYTGLLTLIVLCLKRLAENSARFDVSWESGNGRCNFLGQ